MTNSQHLALHVNPCKPLLNTQELLTEALGYSKAVGASTSVAECLLFLARLEVLANSPGAVVLLVQEAQQQGGNAAFWQQSAELYAEARLQMRGGVLDAKQALEGAAAMLQQVAR